MSLQYNILWVDDRKENYQTLEIDKELILYLKELFFEPHIYMYESVEEAEENMGQRRYDVIFSDFNIGEKKDGKDFIADIRNRNVNSEILFYSAKQTPPAMSMDRISFLRLQSDSSYEELKNKMKSVIDLTVEKLNDLTNLRGLVMAEVSELDVVMKNLIVDYCNGNEANESELREYIIGKIEGRLKKSLDMPDCDSNCHHKWKNKKIPEVVFEQNFDSYTTARALNHIFEKRPELKIKNFLKDYNDAIILNRNWLAHCQTKQKENGVEILITNKGDKEFSSGDIRNIRENIIKYHNIFESVKERI